MGLCYFCSATAVVTAKTEFSGHVEVCEHHAHYFQKEEAE